MIKKILYIDMDNVLVDFPTGIAALSDELKEAYKGNYDETPGIFSLMQPMKGAVEAVNALAEHYDIYVLSTAPWRNPSAWSDKLQWIQKYFGKEEDSPLYKRLILSHHKDLNRGDYLVDDRTKNGAEDFQGELILFGSETYPDWDHVVRRLLH